MHLALTLKGNGAKVTSFLLAKNPENLYERSEKGNVVRLVYTTFSTEEVKVLLYVKPDPIELVKNSADFYDITHYINDREFATSSIFLSGIRKALGTALNGKPKEEYTKWVKHPFEIEASFGPVASDLRDQNMIELFEPMGYRVKIERGQSFIRDNSSARLITVTGVQTLQDCLKHLFILIPVLDNYKHYFIDERELEKLERYGEGWLETHPQKELILKRSLRFQNILAKSKFYEKEPVTDKQTEIAKVRLNDLRYQTIIETIKQLPHKASIVDLGAGEGKLSVQLGFVDGVKEILSIEPSNHSRLKAMERFEQANQRREFLEPKLLSGSLFYFDERLMGKDVMILCEVIEHIEANRLDQIFQMILTDYFPNVLIVTTPNKEYNTVYEMKDEMRHGDHRFEWTRKQFQQKCKQWIEAAPYEVTFTGIGEDHSIYGQPTQMAIFSKKAVK
nr:3' terminal RNA ribose 2'-O-methyltransferase Hen1 [Bacillus rubiinfantis]